MKLATDKYGRAWLIKGSTYTLLNINHTGKIPPTAKLEVSNEIVNKIKI